MKQQLEKMRKGGSKSLENQIFFTSILVLSDLRHFKTFLTLYFHSDLEDARVLEHPSH